MAQSHTVKQSSPKGGTTTGGKVAPLREPTKESHGSAGGGSKDHDVKGFPGKHGK